MAQPQTTPAIQTIVLLEQNKIEQNDPNGTFSINLPHPVTLNDGDAINLSKSFIDTSTEDTNFITISDDDADVVITTGLYLNDIEPNVPVDNPDSKPSFGEWSVPLAERPRGTTFICSNHSESNLHTFLTWEQSNNTFTPVGSTTFSVEFTTIDQAFVTANPSLLPYLGVAHYIVTGAPDLGDAPTDPASVQEVIQQKFILGGFVNNVTINNKHEFFFYHRSTLASQIDETNQNHIAVFDIWATNPADPLTRKGWRGKQNSDTTFPISAGQPVLGKWQFESDADGYNYFSDGGRSHIVNMDTIKFPFDTNWTAGLPSSPDYVPGVEITWIDATAIKKPTTTSLSKSFEKYLPRTEYPADEGQGITTLIKQLDKPASPFKASKFIKHDSLPEEFRKGHGWSRDWYWYEWTNWVDPLDQSSQRVFPRLEFDLHNPPILGTPSYDSNGKPIDRAFGNPSSQFATFDPTTKEWKGNTLQPFQMVLSPVSNPTSQGCTLTPRQYTTKFRIPPGDYSYSDLAQFITDKLNNLESPVKGQQNNPNDPNCPLNAAGFSNSYLLQDTYALGMQYDGLATGASFANATTYPNNYTFSAVQLPDRTARNVNTGALEQLGIIQPVLSTDEGHQPYWVSESGEELFRFFSTNVFTGVVDGSNSDPTKGPRVFGAENFSLIFDDTSQRFQILEAHTPIYIDGPILSASGATPVVKGPGSAIIKQMGGAPNTSIGFRNEQLTIDTSSGVFLYDLQPRSLWFDKMGFDASILTPTSLTGSVQNFATTGSSFVGQDASLLEAKTYPMSLTTGINKTGYFTGVDLLIQKNNLYSKIDAAGGQDVETTTPVGLDGRPLLAAGDDQPFYSIEMSGINNQDLMGQPYNNSLIQALVGKYYSQGNFTESESDGIQYIHKGEPLTIQSIRTRILNTQLELEPRLGTNSAFVLTIEKTK